MDSQIGIFIGKLFSTAADLMRINFPGFSFSILHVLIGALCITITLRIFGYIVGISFTSSLRDSVRGGNNKKVKIDEKRRGDTL